MIRIIDIDPINVYTCQYCGLEFKTTKDFRIEPQIRPVCSSECKFSVIFRFIKNSGLTDKELELMHKNTLKNPKMKGFNKNLAIYEISKHYAKWDLSSIKFFRTKGQEKGQEDKSLTLGQRDNKTPPTLVGGCPLSCPTLTLDKFLGGKK